MRVVFNQQLSLGEVSIEHINLDLSSRDDIPLILRGLQHIYCNLELREKVFSILEEVIPCHQVNDELIPVSPLLGRPGMSQWEILVLGSLRLGLNTDYDRLLELANEHRTIRQMLGFGLFDHTNFYQLSTLRGNLILLTPDIMSRISIEVVKAGHVLLGQDALPELHGRCDSSVVKTHVHYPTDINLLKDAVRVVLRESHALSNDYDLPGWRNYVSNYKTFRKRFRLAQTIRYSNSKDPEKCAAREEAVHQAYRELLAYSEELVTRAERTLKTLNERTDVLPKETEKLTVFIAFANQQIDQTRRRVLENETIPHAEKVFSLFQPHTEWKNKGKAGVSVELGKAVCFIEDEHGFILNHHVMESETDDQVCVDLVKAVRESFPTFNQCSFDKGFWSKKNFEELNAQLDLTVLPKKGKLSKEDEKREYSKEFIEARHQHSAVESAINALQVHGLDKCPDHGLDGFKRYVSLGVLSRNIQLVGAILLKEERKKEKRRLRQAKKLAA